MNIEQYNELPDSRKKELLIDAQKVGEYENEIATFELFQINDFYVEASKSVTHKFLKINNTYKQEHVPSAYYLQV
jgi:hypothetical protein